MVLGEARLAIPLVVLLLIPTSSVGAVAPPAAVSAFVAGGASLVYWLPADPSEGQVTYNVYGFDGAGTKIFLDNTELTTTLIFGVYEAFAVAAVVDGVESQLAYSIGGICVRSGEVPPIDSDCSTVGLYGGIIIPRP